MSKFFKYSNLIFSMKRLKSTSMKVLALAVALAL